jgi:anti-sigma factor RsiW
MASCRTGYRKTIVGDLLHLHNAHEKAQMLLPWYANGTLEPGESTVLEAHLAECDQCRAELAADRRLRELYAATSAPGQPVRPVRIPPATGASWPLARRLSSGWGKVAQLALAAAAAVTLIVVVMPNQRDGEYRLLGSGDATAQGNAIVLFSPDTAARDLRAALEHAGARLVDGPTASGAYIVQVPEQRRTDALAELRGLPQVVLAEPVDAAGGP